MLILRISLVAALAGPIASSAQAATIVNWGGNYVSADQGFVGVGQKSNGILFNTSDDTGEETQGKRFNQTIALSPTIGANYSGTSARFFGGYANARKNASNVSAGFTTQAVVDGVTDVASIIHSQGGGSTSQPRLFASYFTWVKADFSGITTETLSLDNSGDLQVNSISFTTATVQAMANSSLRWFIQSGGNFYLSDTDLTGDSNIASDTTYSSTALELAAMTWRQVPLTDNSLSRMFVDDGFPGGIAGSTLTDIQAIGVYGDSSKTGGSADTVQFSMKSFQVDAVESAIPEPASLSLLAAGALLLLPRRRRA